MKLSHPKFNKKNIILIIIVLLAFTFFSIVGCAFYKSRQPYFISYQQGQFYFAQKNFPASINSYSKSIEFNPDYGYSYTSRAMAYLELKNYEKAKEDLEMAEKICKNCNASTFFLKFVLYSQQGKFDDAYKYLDKKLYITNRNWIRRKIFHIENNPAHPFSLEREFLKVYAIDLITAGNIEKAHEVYIKSIKYYPDEYFGYLGLAYIEEAFYKDKIKSENYSKKAQKLGADKIMDEDKYIMNYSLIKRTIINKEFR